MARMVTFFTRPKHRAAVLVALGLSVGALAGCTTPHPTLANDFGSAVHEDMLAQISDPERAYPAQPPPTNGARVGLAMERYRTGKVIQPMPAAASKIGVQIMPATPPQ